MNKIAAGILGIFLFLLSAAFAFAQGFLEYGKSLGDVVQRKQSAGPKGPTGAKELDKGKSLSKGLQRELGAPSFPSVLTVISKEARLYTGHDEFASKVAHLSQGEKLVPMIQTDGGNALWYMVKTQTGTMGWVKASDVRVETIQKQ